MWKLNIEQHGFAIIPNVLSSEEIVGLGLLFENAPAKRSRAGVRHAMGIPEVASLARGKELKNIAQTILGSNALPFRATLFDKSPASNWLVVWHQDTALPLRERREQTGWGPWSIKDRVLYAHAPARALEEILALRVHLDDSTESNGPLRVLPCTHRSGVLTDDQIHANAGKILAETCLASSGCVLAMRPLIVHSSSKSSSASPRRVLHIEYASSRVLADGMELAVA